MKRYFFPQSLTIAGLVIACGSFGARSSLATALPDFSRESFSAAAIERSDSATHLTAQVTPEQLEFLQLDPETVEQSPTLQQWLEDIPDLQAEIRNDPSFRSRLQVGVTAIEAEPYLWLGVEDWQIGNSALTIDANAQVGLETEQTAIATRLQSRLLPLGSRVNLGPSVGYRNLAGTTIDRQGMTAGVAIFFALSRSGSADLTLRQEWVDVLSGEPISVTELSTGYALTSKLRVATGLEWRCCDSGQEEAARILLEFMP